MSRSVSSDTYLIVVDSNFDRRSAALTALIDEVFSFLQSTAGNFKLKELLNGNLSYAKIYEFVMTRAYKIYANETGKFSLDDLFWCCKRITNILALTWNHKSKEEFSHVQP